MRGVGAVEALRELLPDIAVVVFALVTQLGDIWFVFSVLVGLYWVGDRVPGIDISRSRAAFVIGLALSGFALTTGLKQLFTLPRPPMPGGVVGLRYVPTLLHGAYIETATASGYGFPSGHALLTTVAWGGLALVLDVSTRKRRVLAAGAVVALVGFSRVALGVHYAADVVAGVVIGLAYLAVVVGLGDGRTRVALWLAAVIAVFGVLVGAVKFDDAATLGATVGAAVTWELLGEQVPAHLDVRWVGVLTAAVGVVVFGGLFGVVYALEPPFLVTALASAAVFAGVLAFPLVIERVEKRIGSPTTG